MHHHRPNAHPDVEAHCHHPFAIDDTGASDEDAVDTKRPSRDTTVLVVNASPTNAATAVTVVPPYDNPAPDMTVDPWRGAWATAFSGVRASVVVVVESSGLCCCCYSTTAQPVDAPLQAILPRDVAAMVLLMLKDDILQPVAIDAVFNDVDARPNWSRAVRLHATRAGELHRAAQMAPRLRVVECDGDPAELSAVLAYGCAALRHLTDLRVDAGVAASFSPAVSLLPIAEYLTCLQLQGWRFAADLDVLARCVRLREVVLISCGVTSADVEAAFGGSAALRSLSLRGCSGVTSLACVAGCTGLETLDVSGTSIVDFASIGSVPALRNVTAARAGKLVSAHGLGGLPALTSVSLESCPALRDVTDLARCTALTSVRLTNASAIESVDSLAAKSTLTELEVGGVPCVTVTTVVLLSQLPRLKLLALDSPLPAPAPSYTPLPGSFPALLRLSVKAAPSGYCYPNPANIPTLRYFNGQPSAKRQTIWERYLVLIVGMFALFNIAACAGLIYLLVALIQWWNQKYEESSHWH